MRASLRFARGCLPESVALSTWHKAQSDYRRHQVEVARHILQEDRPLFFLQTLTNLLQCTNLQDLQVHPRLAWQNRDYSMLQVHVSSRPSLHLHAHYAAIYLHDKKEEWVAHLK